MNSFFEHLWEKRAAGRLSQLLEIADIAGSKLMGTASGLPRLPTAIDTVKDLLGIAPESEPPVELTEEDAAKIERALGTSQRSPTSDQTSPVVQSSSPSSSGNGNEPMDTPHDVG